jgi:hypothetical protein
MVEHHIWLVGEIIERARQLPPGQLGCGCELKIIAEEE